MGKNKYVLISVVVVMLIVIGSVVWPKKQIEISVQKKADTGVKISSTITLTPTLYPTSEVTQMVIATVTTVPSQIPPTSVPTEKVIIPLNTPAPPTDNTVPIIKIISGPADGGTLASSNFCFVIQVSDNNTGMTARNKLDNGNWTDWGAGSSQSSPCLQNVAAGSHTFYVEAKDQVGNTASISRTFTTTVSH